MMLNLYVKSRVADPIGVDPDPALEKQPDTDLTVEKKKKTDPT